MSFLLQSFYLFFSFLLAKGLIFIGNGMYVCIHPPDERVW